MKNLIQEILINRNSRNSNFLTAFITITFTVGHPWG